MRKSLKWIPAFGVVAFITWLITQGLQPSNALAQATAAGFTPCASGITISATSVTSNSQLNTCGTIAVIWNTGSADVFLNWGTLSTTAATTSGWALPAGGSITLNSGRAGLYLAAITSAGSATLRVVQGNGGPAIAGGNGGSSGGAASTSGGATPFSIVAANSNNSTLISAGPHTVYGAQLGGVGAAPAYLKLYDKATAPTCGSDTPVARYIIPAASTAALGGGSNVSLYIGKAFTLGLGICVVTGITDADNTSVAASTFLINIDWK